jgi:hypothetical protein
VIDYYDYFQEVQPTLPSFMPEFQGGSYNPWAGPEGGCPQDTSSEFANLFYRWNIGQRVTAMSLYMLYGGTNWGAIAAPVTATSYDYSAPISEDRSIGAKYSETKLLALFTRTAKDLTMTEAIGNGTQYTTNTAVRAFELRNPQTNAGFYVTFHTDTTVGGNQAFKLHVNTSVGALTVPKNEGLIQLNGHQSKIIVTDFTLGKRTLLYSTAEVLTYAVFENRPTLVLWVPTGESGEFAIKGAKSGKVENGDGCSGIKFKREKDYLVVNFSQAKGLSVLRLDNGVRVVLLDKAAAYRFWAPALTDDPNVQETETGECTSYRVHCRFILMVTVLVHGPYLVRSASISKTTLALRGDSVEKTTLEIFAPHSVRKITWNGKEVQTSHTPYGSLKATLAAPPDIKLPALTSWRSNDSLPERLPLYDDSGPAWIGRLDPIYKTWPNLIRSTEANHMTTSNPSPPATFPVLYADEYGMSTPVSLYYHWFNPHTGFHNGVRLWRGYFNGSASGVFLNIQGGSALYVTLPILFPLNPF